VSFRGLLYGGVEVAHPEGLSLGDGRRRQWRAVYKFAESQGNSLEGMTAVSFRRSVRSYRGQFGEEPAREAVCQGALKLASIAAEEKSPSICNWLHEHWHVASGGQAGRHLPEHA
jgi:hypothetical protein